MQLWPHQARGWHAYVGCAARRGLRLRWQEQSAGGEGVLCAQNRVVFSNALPGLARICLHLPICFAPHTLAVCTIVLHIRHKMKLQPTCHDRGL